MGAQARLKFTGCLKGGYGHAKQMYGSFPDINLESCDFQLAILGMKSLGKSFTDLPLGFTHRDLYRTGEDEDCVTFGFFFGF